MRGTHAVRGFAAGAVATVAMSLAKAAGTVAGVSPIPEPIPKTVVTSLLGVSGPTPLVAGLAVGLHLAYGGVFGALLATGGRPVTLGKAVGLAVALWLAMQLVLLPALGWGVFGTAVTPAVAAATLALHLVYGVVLSLALGRTLAGNDAPDAASAD